MMAPRRCHMGHKKSQALLALSFIAILVPLASGANHLKQIAPSNPPSPVRIAYANRGPPVPPPPRDLTMQSGTESILFADRNPRPPTPPPTRAMGQAANEYVA